MKQIYILILLHLHLAFAAQQHHPVFNKWTSPNSESGALKKRGVSYEPEFGACEDGQETCSDACGDGFEECGAGTYAAVFCYNPDGGETCCGDEEGTACVHGFYCASGGDGTVCCPDSLSLSECEGELKVELSSTSSPESSSKKEDPPEPKPTPGPEPPVQRSSTSTTENESTTYTNDERSSTVEDEITTTITKSSTTTVIKTVPFPSSSLSSPASSPPLPAPPATPLSPVQSASHLSSSSFPSPITISSPGEILPSQPSFINATTSRINETDPPIKLEPTLPTNTTSATGRIGVPIFLPTALDSLHCDLDCDEESGAEIEVSFTETVTERVIVTLQDDSNGCERITTLTPTFILTTLETITLECSGVLQKNITPPDSVHTLGGNTTQRIDVKPKETVTVYRSDELLEKKKGPGSDGILASITTLRADEKPKATVTVYHPDELLESVTNPGSDGVLGGIATQRADERPETKVHDSEELLETTMIRGSGGVPADVATQNADEKPKTKAHDYDELPENTVTRGFNGVPADIATQKADEKPKVTDHKSDELPGDTATLSDPEPTGHKSVDAATPPSIADGDREDVGEEEAVPSTTLSDSDDASPTFEIAAGTRFAPEVACIAALALMGVEAAM